MRLIDADALISALCLEDGEPQQYCFPCRKMFSAIRSAPTIPELTSEEIRELSSWSYGRFHKKIADWLQAESEGRLVVLPCKVGDTVWGVIFDTRDCPNCVGVDGCFGCSSANPIDVYRTPFALSMYNKIGKTVFLTREEAEATMKGAVDDERP